MHYQDGQDDRKNGSNDNPHIMYELRKTNSACSASHEVYVSELWRDSDKTRSKVQEIRSSVQVPEMRVHRAVGQAWRIRNG